MASPSTRLVSKFVATYEKLFNGYTPQEITPNETPAQFWSNLLSLNIDQEFLTRKLRRTSKDDVLAFHKPFLNTLISTCLFHLRTDRYGDARKENACVTLMLVLRCLLEKEKNLAGWEVMEVIAGGVGASDAVFLDLTGTIDMILSDGDAPPELKHKVLQLALTYACGISQLSPGAYFLRQDLFPAIANIIKSQATQAFTFEASLLLSILANFHRSDAAKLNPYLRALQEVEDREMLRGICWSAGYAVEGVVRAYQEISDDSPPTFATSMGNLLASFRPDRALSATPVDPPRELFKNQPVEAAVILLPIHDFIHLNARFSAVLLEPLLNPDSSTQPSTAPTSSSTTTAPTPPSSPLLHTFISASSYILTHATSVSTPRAAAYAHLCLATLLYLAENDVFMSVVVREGASAKGIRLCRQRMPCLPVGLSTRPVLCAMLDCCVLWLRHNLHKRLEAQSYITCVWILQQVVWFLSRRKNRLDYHWEEIWRSLISLLDFISTKLGKPSEGGRIEQLVQETILLLDLSLRNADSFLGSPQAVHQFTYEIVRSLSTLENQTPTCSKPSHKRLQSVPPSSALQRILDSARHYEKKIQAKDNIGAPAVLRLIGKEIEREGLVYAQFVGEEDAPTRSSDLGEIGFVRFAYADGLALMPGSETSA